jgi:hypothetical protein
MPTVTGEWLVDLGSRGRSFSARRSGELVGVRGVYLDHVAAHLRLSSAGVPSAISAAAIDDCDLRELVGFVEVLVV